MDILGKALTDFYEGRKNRPTLLIHNHYGDPDFMDPAIYFRKPQAMPKVELFALSLCEKLTEYQLFQIQIHRSRYDSVAMGFAKTKQYMQLLL